MVVFFESLRIGVFDSGVGGLTVFSALHDALPHHDLIYLEIPTRSVWHAFRRDW